MPGMASASTGANSADQMDASMAAAVKAFPAKTQGLGGQLMEPAVQPDGTKQYELTAKVTPWEVSPGHVVQAWTYNGTVPGPTIHVRVGDKVRVILHNQLPESTSIHFHGLIVPNAMDGVPDITQPPIKPGKDFTYEFTAQGPAVGMYHSHHDSAKQVTNGLVGALLVGEEPLPNNVQPTQEFPFVLNDAGVIRDQHQRQVVPCDRALLRQDGRLGPGPLLQRGVPDPPDAPARDPSDGGGQGRLSAGKSLPGGHRTGGPR